MSTSFWSEQTDLKDLFSKLIADDDSIKSLWDIFSSYEMIQYKDQADDADTSEQWLSKQSHIIDEAMTDHFSDVELNEENITDILDTIEAISEGDSLEEQGLDPQWSDPASAIINKHLVSEQMSASTLYNFLDAFEHKLLMHNKQYIVGEQQQALRELLESQTNLSEELKQQLLGNIEHSLVDELPGEQEDEGGPLADWPRLTLAYSTTFFSDDDGGAIDYDERETIVSQKISDYKSQITDLLGQSPDSKLQPLPITPDMANDEKALYAFYDVIAKESFSYVFEGDCVAWQSDDKVLFLYIEKEDNELPYEIVLGGMLLTDYQPMLQRYNNAVNKYCH